MRTVSWLPNTQVSTNAPAPQGGCGLNNGRVTANGSVHRADDLVGVELAVGVKIKGNPSGDWLQLLGVDMADDGDEGARLLGGLGRVSTCRQKLDHRTLGRDHREFF